MVMTMRTWSLAVIMVMMITIMKMTKMTKMTMPRITWSLVVTPDASALPKTGASSIEDGGRLESFPQNEVDNDEDEYEDDNEDEDEDEGTNLQASAASKAVSLSLMFGRR